MSINIKNKNLPSQDSVISQRKQTHIDVCKTAANHNIESLPLLGFESLSFLHTALPEINYHELNTEIEFLNKKIRFPFFISCMTGGSEEGSQANKRLALAAQAMRLPIGLGSFRVLLTDPNRIKDFTIRNLAPDVPIMANIGAVQVRDVPKATLINLLQKLEVDALVIHLNCGQELFQSGGDREFKGLKSAISRAVENFGHPIIVKETGFGIKPSLVKELIRMGVTYVDVAGAGGTNWILVEKSCNRTDEAVAEEFADWGIPTAILIDTLREFEGKILASGGLRTGMDLTKAIALGSLAGGMALPLIRSALEGGEEAVCSLIQIFEKVLRNVMILTGCKNMKELRNVPILKSSAFQHYASSIKAIDIQ